MWWSQNAKIHLNIHADNYDLHYKGLLAIIVVMKQFEPGEYCRFHRQYVWYMLIVEIPNSNKINSLMCYVEEHEEAPKTTHVWQGKKNLQRRTVIPFKFFLWNHRDVNIRRGEAKTTEVNVARNLKTKIFRIKTFFANSGSQHSLEGFPGQKGKATRYMVLGKLTLSRICNDKLRKHPLLQNSDLIQDLFRVAALGRQRQQQQGGDLGTRF